MKKLRKGSTKLRGVNRFFFSKKGQSLVFSSLVWPNPEHYFHSHWQAHEMAAQWEVQLREHFHKPIILSAAPLYEDSKQNKKALSWHLPCGFTEKPTFPPPSLLENLTFHLRIEVVTEVFLHGGQWRGGWGENNNKHQPLQINNFKIASRTPPGLLWA